MKSDHKHAIPYNLMISSALAKLDLLEDLYGNGLVIVTFPTTNGDLV